MSRAPGATVGGQAVIEGVMMRAPEGWAVAVRRPDEVIEAQSHELPRLSARSKAARIPFLRGVMVLVESLSLGFRALSWSAAKAGEDEDGEQEVSKSSIVGAMVLALVFFIAIFILLPLVVARGIDSAIGGNALTFNIIDGLIRVGLFIGYIWVIGLSKDIQRVFQYHGAEHKTIHAYENGDPMQIAAIQKYSPRHPRCGTNFLMIVIIISLVVFTFVGRPSLLWLIASRILLIPVIAGVSYEILKAAATHRWLAIASKPGMWLQKLTTREPYDDQVEVAISSLLAALDADDVTELEARGAIEPAALGAEFNAADG